MSSVHRALFWLLVYLGRRFGGIRPRRLTYWLHRKSFMKKDFSSHDHQWWSDRWGSQLRLNPYYLVDCSVIAFGAYDPTLHHYINANIRPGMICFDVGANIGTVATHLGRKVGASGQVHAFEPVPTLRERLKENVERNQLERIVQVHALALSDRTGIVTLALADQATPNQGLASLVSRDPTLSERMEVPTTTIDEFVNANSIDRIDFMKIDIQGGEILLLDGGPHTFGKLGPDLLIEVSPEDLPALGKNSKDLLVLLEGYGYRIYELRANGAPSRRIWANQASPDYWMSNVLCTKKPIGG